VAAATACTIGLDVETGELATAELPPSSVDLLRVGHVTDSRVERGDPEPPRGSAPSARSLEGRVRWYPLLIVLCLPDFLVYDLRAAYPDAGGHR
jgi:hypothetical protein